MRDSRTVLTWHISVKIEKKVQLKILFVQVFYTK